MELSGCSERQVVHFYRPPLEPPQPLPNHPPRTTLLSPHSTSAPSSPPFSLTDRDCLVLVKGEQADAGRHLGADPGQRAQLLGGFPEGQAPQRQEPGVAALGL